MQNISRLGLIFNGRGVCQAVYRKEPVGLDHICRVACDSRRSYDLFLRIHSFAKPEVACQNYGRVCTDWFDKWINRRNFLGHFEKPSLASQSFFGFHKHAGNIAVVTHKVFASWSRQLYKARFARIIT